MSGLLTCRPWLRTTTSTVPKDLGGLLGQALDERLVIEVSGDVKVVGLGGVEPLPAAGEQQPRALAAEVGRHRLPDPAAGAGDQGGDVVKSHVGVPRDVRLGTGVDWPDGQLRNPRASTGHRCSDVPALSVTISSSKLITTGHTWLGTTGTTVPTLGRDSLAGTARNPWYSLSLASTAFVPAMPP